MDILKHYQSIEAEFRALKDRVENLIDDAHWLTVGESKEAILRSVLRQRLPDTVKIGRGFIVTTKGASRQCDILLYRSDAPVLFRDDDLVFLTPEAVLGVIEVKTRIRNNEWVEVVKKLSGIRTLMGKSASQCFLGIFSYEDEGKNSQSLRRALNEGYSSGSPVQFICLGGNRFVRWWERSPKNQKEKYRKWHLYETDGLAPGYFITNVIDFVTFGKIEKESTLWFPEGGKERFRGSVIHLRKSHD